MVLQLNVLEPLVPSMHHKSMQIHSDNTRSVAWLNKMATKTANSDAAHRLIRGLALRQRMLHSAPVSITHVAGSDNNLADIALQAITQHDDDHAFLMHFDNLFPLLERFWQRASSPPAQLSNVISTLRGQCLTMQRWTVPLKPPAGAGGNITEPIGEHIRGCATQLPRSAASNSRDLPPGLALDSLGKVGKLEPRPLKKPCVTWHKPSCSKDTPTPTSRRWLQPGFVLYPPPEVLPGARPCTKTPGSTCVHAIDLVAAARNDPNALPCEAATAHLIVMAFYFLLRVGKYTLPPGHRTTRTVQFCICNIRFWQGQTLLPPTSDEAASSVTLIMDNQKNEQRCDVMHQEAVNADFCPVCSTAAIVSSIMAQGMPLMTPISFVHPGIHVQPPHILHAVLRRRSKLAKLTDIGYSLSRIGAHLLHASALWLSGHGPEAIMILGR